MSTYIRDTNLNSSASRRVSACRTQRPLEEPGGDRLLAESYPEYTTAVRRGFANLSLTVTLGPPAAA